MTEQVVSHIQAPHLQLGTNRQQICSHGPCHIEASTPQKALAL